MPIHRRRDVYLSPYDDCHAALLGAAQSATKSLHVLVYSITLPSLADAVIARQAAGCRVGVVTDRTQAAGRTEHALLQRLVAAGVPVTIATSTTGAIMHLKVLLVDVEYGPLDDRSLVVYGSFNFTGDQTSVAAVAHTGAQREDNLLVVSNDPGEVAFYWQVYQEIDAYGRAHVPQLTPAQVVTTITVDGATTSSTVPLPPAS